MKDPFEKVRFLYPLYDDTYIDFFPKNQSEEVNKIIERYIKKKLKIIKLD